MSKNSSLGCFSFNMIQQIMQSAVQWGDDSAKHEIHQDLDLGTAAQRERLRIRQAARESRNTFRNTNRPQTHTRPWCNRGKSVAVSRKCRNDNRPAGAYKSYALASTSHRYPRTRWPDHAADTNA